MEEDKGNYKFKAFFGRTYTTIGECISMNDITNSTLPDDEEVEHFCAYWHRKGYALYQNIPIDREFISYVLRHSLNPDCFLNWLVDTGKIERVYSQDETMKFYVENNVKSALMERRAYGIEDNKILFNEINIKFTEDDILILSFRLKGRKMFYINIPNDCIEGNSYHIKGIEGSLPIKLI